MWRILRVELAYLLPWLLGGLGLALGVTTLVTGIFAIFGGPPELVATAIRVLFPMVAAMIVAFIAQAHRTQERRVRLLLAGPSTPGQLAVVSALIPFALGACGALAAGSIVAVESAIRGTIRVVTLHLVGYVGGQLTLYALIGLLIGEVAFCGRQRRRRAAAAGWATLIAGTILVAVVTVGALTDRGPWTWPILHAANLVAAVGTAVVTVSLFTARTDFTR